MLSLEDGTSSGSGQEVEGTKREGPSEYEITLENKNKQVWFIYRVFVCACACVCYFEGLVVGMSASCLLHLFKEEGVGEGWSFDTAVKSVTGKVLIEIYFRLCWH